MATNTEVNVRINVDAKGADSSVGSIKKQLRDATNELVEMREKFGESSAEAVEAAKKVAQLKDAIGDAKAMTDAFDPDAKFKAFGATLQGVAGGFAAVQGAQALFGAESEAVQKTLAKVQGAMALSQGINSVLQAKDAFKNLGAVLSNNVVIQRLLNFVMTGSLKTQQQLVAQKQVDATATITQTAATTGLTVAQNAARIAAIALRGALAATGIGLLVIGVGALVSKIGDWISGEKDSEKAIEASNKALEAQQENYKNISDEIKYQGELRVLQAKLAGESEHQIFEIQQKTNEEATAAAKANYEKQKKLASDYYNQVGELRDDGNRYFTEKESEQLHKLYAAQDSAYKELEDLQRDHTKNALNEQIRLHELQTQANEKIYSLEQEAYLANIKGDREKAKAKLDFEHANAVKEITTSENDAETKGKLIKLVNEKWIREKNAVDEAENKKEKDKRDAKSKQIQAETDAENKRIADATKALNEKIAALENEVYLMSIENEDKRAKEKLRIQFEAGIREIEQSKANENLKLDAILALQAKYDADLKAVDDARAKKNQEEADAKRQKAIDYENETFDLLEENRISRIQDANQKALEQESKRYQADIDKALEALNKKEIDDLEYKKRREAIETIHQSNLTDIAKAAAQERANVDAAEIQARGQVIDAYASMATSLVNVFKDAGAKTKGFQIASLIIEQAAAIAKIVTSTQTANAAALATPQAVATSGVAAAPVILRNNIQAGISIAAALAATAKGITQIKGANQNSTGGGGGGNLPGAAGGTSAPLPPQMSTTMLNQGQINQLSSATARAFVLESDVTGNQERIQRLNRAARIS